MARLFPKRTTASEPARHPQSEAAPVVLAHVLMDVSGDGTMAVTVDGAPVDPPEFAPAWRREDFTRILDQLMGQFQSPLRVEVREADGTTFTDIITPSTHRPGPPPRPAPPIPAPPAPKVAVATGEGFLPGEDVAVAVVIAHGDAAPDGTVRAHVIAEQVAASPTREVILLGRVSGTLTIGHPQ